MEFDEGKVDEMVLALLYLNMFEDRYAVRAWKTFDWDSMDRLYEQGSSKIRKAKPSQSS